VTTTTPDRRVDQLHRGLIFAESSALKAKLSGISVPRPGGDPRRVRTYFRYPDEQTERIYPFITIEFMSMQLARDRAHSAQMVPIDYWPSEYATFAEYAEAHNLTEWTGRVGSSEAVMWHPYNMLFQISVHSRDPIDAMYLDGQLIGTHYIPDRWGYLDIPEDGSCRWLDRLEMRTANYIEGNPQAMNQTVFRTIYTVSVNAHVPPIDPNVFFQALRIVGVILKISLRPGSDPVVLGSWINEAPEAPSP
jgi:hypothetical protein